MVGSLGAAPNSFGSLVPIPDPFGLATITIRDLTHVPQAGASVVIDFSGCSDIRICCDQADVECIVCCIDKTVKKLANVLGQVSFIVLGGSTGSGNATSLQGCARIYANGVLLRTPTSSCFDLDGANGVGINDLSVWLTDFGNGTSAASCTLASPGPALMNRGDGSSAALVSCPKNQPIQNQWLESCPR